MNEYREAHREHRSEDPINRCGIYKSYDEVPERRRLYQFAAAYDGRDVWAEYCEHRGLSSHRFTRTGPIWSEFVAEHGDDESPHPALVTPETVERWFRWSIGERSVHTTYLDYGAKIEGMFRWLMESTAHPHLYSPVLLAYADETNEHARVVWDYKLDYRSRKQ